jgi:hypothetical protein
LVHSIITEDDSTDAAIQRMIEAIRSFIREDNNDNDDDDSRSKSQDGEQEKDAAQGIIPVNPAMKRHFQLEIQTLQNALGDAAKLEQIIKSKE